MNQTTPTQNTLRRPEVVAERTAEQQERRQGQRVAGHHPLECPERARGTPGRWWAGRCPTTVASIAAIPDPRTVAAMTQRPGGASTSASAEPKSTGACPARTPVGVALSGMRTAGDFSVAPVGGSGRPDDDEHVGGEPPTWRQDHDPAQRFLHFYDEALPHVYGYLARRCGRRPWPRTCAPRRSWPPSTPSGASPPAVSVPWAMAWPATSSSTTGGGRPATSGDSRCSPGPVPEPPEVGFDPATVDTRRLLDSPLPQHRAALTLRYLDDLSVPEVAQLLGRSVHATEALLVRARVAFRRAYDGSGGTRDG